MCELGVNPGSVDGLHRLINRVGAVNEKGAKISMRAAIKDLVKKKKKGVLTVVLVWGWTGREALGETGVYFCSDDCREKKTGIRKGNINIV